MKAEPLSPDYLAQRDKVRSSSKSEPPNPVIVDVESEPDLFQQLDTTQKSDGSPPCKLLSVYSGSEHQSGVTEIEADDVQPAASASDITHLKPIDAHISSPKTGSSPKSASQSAKKTVSAAVSPSPSKKENSESATPLKGSKLQSVSPSPRKRNISESASLSPRKRNISESASPSPRKRNISGPASPSPKKRNISMAEISQLETVNKGK